MNSGDIMNYINRLTIRKSNNRGVALIYVVLVLLIVSIFSVSILAIFNGNLNQEEYQKQYAKAYYLAYSGVQMAFSALNVSGTPSDLFTQLKNGTISKLPLVGTQQVISFGDGTIAISAIKITDPTSPYIGWIKISSTGTLSSNSISVTRCLYINPIDQKDTVWKNN